MKVPSTAQSRILEQLASGERLALDTKTGRYTMNTLDGRVKQIDQRPVLVMLRDGLLCQDVAGRCRAANEG
jgi:hypothetical protein